MTQIIDAYLGLIALRQAGYRSTATAVAELVDNSIEAKANKIDIIAVSKRVLINARSSNQVQKIVVLDNGEGMHPDILEKCLSLGWGTRLDTREGLGRFGFGLKGASISQARCVEVYSWIEKEKVYKAYLDLDEIHSGQQQVLNDIKKCPLPEEILTAFGSGIGDSGTLVVWAELDQMDLKRVETLIKRVNKELCRIYRHFLDDDDTYGKKRIISLHSLQLEDGKVETKQLKANDPLYILKPNNVEGYENESTNVYHGESFEIDIPYMSGNTEQTSKVGFRFTISLPSIQNLGGKSIVGKHYGNNTGISFVRSGREIDFGSFGFLDASEPRHRWWGAEIRFEPVLDELFGVTNNKQEVRAITKYDDEMLEILSDESEHGDRRAFLLLQINKLLSEHIKEMMKIITGRREGERKRKTSAGTLIDKVNQEVSKDTSRTESDDHRQETSEEEKIIERVKLLLEDDASLSEEDALEEAEKTLDYRVDITTAEWPGDLFLDRKPVANASVGIVNRNTQFYEVFWRYLEDLDDRKGYEALEVLMMALIRAEDELSVQYDKRTFERFRQKWGSWVEQLISHAGS